MHVLPQQYIVDDNDGIKDPLGLSGHRLEAKVHLVTSSINTENDILTCLDKIGRSIFSKNRCTFKKWPKVQVFDS